MSLKEEVVREVELLPEAELGHIAEYLAFLRYQARRRRRLEQLSSPASSAGLYAEFADEDRGLAEDGLADYFQSLAAEDAA